MKQTERRFFTFFRKGSRMTDSNEVFHFDDSRPNFENLAKENGFRYWLASELMDRIGYTTMPPIMRAVNKAMAACAHLGIQINENFAETTTSAGARDWKLSRFACYLTVMNSDPKKPNVAKAQAYFITMAEAFRHYIQENEEIERVVIRGDLTDRETALSATVHSRGVEKIQFFQNSGYRGMYNLDLRQLKRKKGVPENRSVLDFMGKTELAANLFRITQTDEKIRQEDIRGQRPLERAAEDVGREVRSTMIRLSGTPPEKLTKAEDIKKIRANLKKTGKEYAKIDGPTNKSRGKK